MTLSCEDIVLCYFRMGFRNRETLQALAHSHGIVISERTLKRITKKLLLFRRKNQSDLLDVALFVLRDNSQVVCMVTDGCIQSALLKDLRLAKK